MTRGDKKAQKAVDFINQLRHTKGKWAGKPFNLRDWQVKDIIWPIFGTLKPDGTRQIRTAYVEIPRKQGKSEIAAAIALFLLFADNEIGAEIYVAAATEIRHLWFSTWLHRWSGWTLYYRLIQK